MFCVINLSFNACEKPKAMYEYVVTRSELVTHSLLYCHGVTRYGVMLTARGQTLSSVCDFTCFWIEVSHNIYVFAACSFSRPPAIPQASASELSRSYTTKCLLLGNLFWPMGLHLGTHGQCT